MINGLVIDFVLDVSPIIQKLWAYVHWDALVLCSKVYWKKKTSCSLISLFVYTQTCHLKYSFAFHRLIMHIHVFVSGLSYSLYEESHLVIIIYLVPNLFLINGISLITNDIQTHTRLYYHFSSLVDALLIFHSYSFQNTICIYKYFAYLCVDTCWRQLIFTYHD